ncbi:hypothetical protein RFI_33089 [Reticulomyxa filosa]|uniref:Uncharacterized protein n=1 Tax=Reticulomyxa filosa TaxID=46433 RepID=X6LRQ3_RETFI|nr:hypothetical protein RFI_33089 [Reticulomyxa filosa]|eukprot:ETO04309.1 hypothetical protein RFI_33089 [Reticulomyxa filosa]
MYIVDLIRTALGTSCHVVPLMFWLYTMEYPLTHVRVIQSEQFFNNDIKLQQIVDDLICWSKHIRCVRPAHSNERFVFLYTCVHVCITNDFFLFSKKKKYIYIFFFFYLDRKLLMDEKSEHELLPQKKKSWKVNKKRWSVNSLRNRVRKRKTGKRASENRNHMIISDDSIAMLDTILSPCHQKLYDLFALFPQLVIQGFDFSFWGFDPNNITSN